ncbi:MAG: alpha-amylase [Chloroflexi bacterium]|nr:alpha-amylase [Chloroflexota bacterium]
MKINTPGWVKDAIFYQIFPDRFARSKRLRRDRLNLESWGSPPSHHGFKGGDLYGVAERLDYLQDLGVTAIYLNPVFASASNHRYHTYDYFNVDPLLGGNAAFRELLDAAHARGMKVVPDGVFNHASRGMWQFHHVLENGAGSPYIDWFHFNPEMLNGQRHWQAYPSPEARSQLQNGSSSYHTLGYSAWWNLPALPKLNTDNPAVREFIFSVAEHWIEFGADGWRLDVPAEIDDDSFWREFRRRVKRANPEAYIVGEIWHESQRWLQGDQFDAVMNYLLTGALMGWLVGDRLPEDIMRIGDYHKYLIPLDAAAFGDRIDYLLGLYAPAVNAAQLNLLDSHDTPRFVTTAGGDWSAWKLGYLFLFTFIGAPCIYYGDEIGLAGGPDPDCRKSFPWEKSAWDKGLHAYIKNLAALRKAHPALRRGAYRRLFSEGPLFAFSRKLGEETCLVVINSGGTALTPDIDIRRAGLPERTPEALFGLTGRDQPRISAGRLGGFRLPARSGAVLGIGQA